MSWQIKVFVIATILLQINALPLLENAAYTDVDLVAEESQYGVGYGAQPEWSSFSGHDYNNGFADYESPDYGGHHHHHHNHHHHHRPHGHREPHDHYSPHHPHESFPSDFNYPTQPQFFPHNPPHSYGGRPNYFNKQPSYPQTPSRNPPAATTAATTLATKPSIFLPTLQTDATIPNAILPTASTTDTTTTSILPTNIVTPTTTEEPILDIDIRIG